MNVFRKAGKKFEETKRKFTSEDADYICRACETSLDTDSEYCPNCGEQAVEPVEPSDS